MRHQDSNKNNIVGGILLVGLGLVLLVGQGLRFNFFDLFENWNVPYTAYIIVPGLVFMAIGLFGGRGLTGLTIFGSIALVTGLLLAFQDATEMYQGWAYMWALVFPGAIGLALALQSLVTQDEEQRKTGLRMMVIALVITLVGWSFFEGAINLSGFGLHSLANFAGPVLLVAIGGWLLLRRGNSGAER